jgi:hypothetical protein
MHTSHEAQKNTLAVVEVSFNTALSVGSRASRALVSTAVSCWFHETLLYLALFQPLSFSSLQLVSFHVSHSSKPGLHTPPRSHTLHALLY